MYPCLARVTDLPFLREAIAEMRNKEVVATGTLLNNGQQVLFVKYLRSYLTLTQRRSQAYRSARRLCGNMEPRSLALITPPSGDSFQTGNLFSFQSLSVSPLNIVLFVCATCIAIIHSGSPWPARPLLAQLWTPSRISNWRKGIVPRAKQLQLSEGLISNV